VIPLKLAKFDDGSMPVFECPDKSQASIFSRDIMAIIEETLYDSSMPVFECPDKSQDNTISRDITAIMEETLYNGSISVFECPNKRNFHRHR
jgi:hypothetical protein